jgi:hypothetical protein
MRKVLLAAAVVLVALVVIGLVAGDRDKKEPVVVDGSSAGCLPMTRQVPPPEGGKHRAGTLDYAEAPPNNGEHSPMTLRNIKRFYSREDAPAAEQAVHDLEHGLVVAWYDDELPADQVAALADVANDAGSRFVAVPWSRSVFEGDRHFVLTAWGRTMRCSTVSAEVVTRFVKAETDGDDAPEKGYSV